MKYYPINLDINNKKCLVVGGGNIGLRKVNTLLQCGAIVTLVSPQLHEELKDLGLENKIKVLNRAYLSTDLDDKFLVICATDDEEINEKVASDARGHNILCNIADRPKLCNFILPAIVQRGDLVLTISTSGKSPAFAKKLKEQFEKEFGDEYNIFLKIMGEIRKLVLSKQQDYEKNREIFEKIIDSDLVEMIKYQRFDKADQLLQRIVGEKLANLLDD